MPHTAQATGFGFLKNISTSLFNSLIILPLWFLAEGIRQARESAHRHYYMSLGFRVDHDAAPLKLPLRRFVRPRAGTVEETRSIVIRDWTKRALHLPGQTEPGPSLRWDPDAERSRALMGVNPNDDGTVVNAPLEWLAFRGLPAFPCVPIGNRIVTAGVTGRRQDELQFHWPLWSCGASYATVHFLLILTAAWVKMEQDARRVIQMPPGGARHRRSIARFQRDFERSIDGRRARGIVAICTSDIRRTAQGFGNFGPTLVRA